MTGTFEPLINIPADKCCCPSDGQSSGAPVVIPPPKNPWAAAIDGTLSSTNVSLDQLALGRNITQGAPYAAANLPPYNSANRNLSSLFLL